MEMVAHFGLGTNPRVDQLEIRWPSGQVDVLTDIPAGQKIRVFEGRDEYHVVEPTVWVQTLGAPLLTGQPTQLRAAVRVSLFEPEARVVRVTADLTEFGGSSEVALSPTSDGNYALDRLVTATENGVKSLEVFIEQETSLGPYWTTLSQSIDVFPGEDEVVFDEDAAGEWPVEARGGVEAAGLSETDVVHRGSVSGAFQVEESFAGWSVTFRSATPTEVFGYTGLRFAVRPGEIELAGSARFTVGLSPGAGRVVSLLAEERLDAARQEWQIVEIPMAAFAREAAIEAVVFSGNFRGTFFLDDIRLVTATPQPGTAVVESQDATVPDVFTLSQNYPNPFNPETTIRFDLPRSEEIELTVYNLTGQKVATLAHGLREAGTYTLRWDGRDDDGRELASGAYLYRLAAGDGIETRKLLLLR